MDSIPAKLNGEIDTELKKSTFLQRRDSPRVIVGISVELEIEGADISAKTINISQEGILVVLKKSLPVSKRVGIKIKFSASSGAIQGKGRIIWILEEAKDKFQCGIYFMEWNSDKDLTMLKQFIKDNIRYKGKIVERRKEERRKENISDMSLDKRKIERRLSKGIFRKCVQYNRINHIKNFYSREIKPVNSTRIEINNKKMIMFGSNDYLGLSVHPKVKKASIEALNKYGNSCKSSRVLAGTFDLHLKLEEKLAELKQGESCIVFNTGYTTNLSTILGLVYKNDIAIVDMKGHASIIDGCNISRGETTFFKHNDMKSLEKILFKYSRLNKIIITDGVFSMDGDIAILDKIYALAQKYNAAVMVDDAHGTGVMGNEGRGTSEYFGLSGKIDIEMGTLSKALGGTGGFIVANKKIISFLKYTGRTFIFSASLPPSITAGLIVAIEILKEESYLRENLWKNTNYMLKEIKLLGYDTGKSQTPIIPIIIKDEFKTYKLLEELQNMNIFVSAIAWPAVKKKDSRLRITINAHHTSSDLNMLLEILGKAGKKLNIL